MTPRTLHATVSPLQDKRPRGANLRFGAPGTAATLALLALLGGCASVAPDGLRGNVAQAVEGKTGLNAVQLPSPEPEARAQAQAAIQEALAQPLTQEAAVRIALLNHPGLQARLAALGIADAERVQSLTLPNPHLSIGRFTNASERELERGLAFNLMHLITWAWRAERSQQAMDQSVLATAQEVVHTAAQARRAWLRAVAAQQVAATHERMHEAAEAGVELARRMVQVGNWSRLQHARELATLQSVRGQQARARLAAAMEREQLHRALGLWGTQLDYVLAPQLPPLPDTLQAAEGLETRALRERLDVQAARRQLDEQAVRERWAGVGAVFGDVGLAYQRNTRTERDSGERSVTRGWELELPLPLLDWGGAARTRAQAEVQYSAARLQETAVRARSEVRAAWHTYRTAHDLARQQQQEVVPLRQFIADETTLRYNGMLVSVWDLLAEARASAQSVATAIEAQRDFWLAETDLQLALTGTSPGALQSLAPGASSSPEKQGH